MQKEKIQEPTLHDVLEAITGLGGEIGNLTKEVEKNGEKINSLTDKVESNSEKISILTDKVESNSKEIRKNTQLIDTLALTFKAESEKASQERTEIKKEIYTIKHDMQDVKYTLANHEIRIQKLETPNN